MGISIYQLEALASQEVLRQNDKVLDIGTSNLYHASAELTAQFLSRFGVTAAPGFCEKIDAGSAYDPVKGGTNEAWVGEVLEEIGCQYVSFDVAKGYKTTLFDLNRERLPEEYRSSFDLVMNFGTTEHVLNQFHALSIIHDATKPGAYMVHQVPCSGFTNHGYFVYTPRFFYDLAAANKYSMLEMSFSGGGHDDVFLGAGKYKPGNKQVGKAANYCITVVYKKVHDQPFRGNELRRCDKVDA